MLFSHQSQQWFLLFKSKNTPTLKNLSWFSIVLKKKTEFFNNFYKMPCMIWPLHTTHSSFLLLLHPHWPHFGLFYAPCTIISIILALKARDRILASPLRQPACWRTFAHASPGMFFPPFWAWLISTLSWHIPLHITLSRTNPSRSHRPTDLFSMAHLKTATVRLTCISLQLTATWIL